MYCTFYRPKNVNTTEFENIIGKLRYDLWCIENEELSQGTIYAYVYSRCKQAQPTVEDSEMTFFHLDDPNKMPPDARVNFVYLPTYLAAAFMIKAVLLHPDLIDGDAFMETELDFSAIRVRDILRSTLLACTGRRFESGGVLRLKDCLQIFDQAGVEEFLEKYYNLCPQFSQLYKTRKEFCESGQLDFREIHYM